MKMNKIEKILYLVASSMVVAILYLTYVGYQRGGYEQNPVAKFLFEIIYRYTGNWGAAILLFIPVAIVGLYIALASIKRDYQNKNPRAGQIFLTAFILLVAPNTTSIVFGLMWDNRFIAPAGFILAIVYLLYEWLRPKTAMKSPKQKK